MILPCLLLAFAATGGFWPEKQAYQLPEPVLAELPSIKLYAESSGMLYERVLKRSSGDGSIVERAFQNGRLVLFSLKGASGDEKLETVDVYADLSRRQHLFHAEYFPGTFRIRASQYFENGKLRASIERSSDGAETRKIYEAGALKQVFSLAADGSSRLETFAADGSSKLAESAAPENERRLVIKGQTYKLRIERKGLKVLGWTLLGEQDQLIHRATFQGHGGNLLIETFIDPDNDTVLRQHWTCLGEDWSRSYFSRAQVELSFGKSDSKMVFITDAQGELVETRYYNGGKFTYSDRGDPSPLDDILGESEENQELARAVLSQPGWEIEAAGELYEFSGVPFAKLPVPSIEPSLLPLK